MSEIFYSELENMSLGKLFQVLSDDYSQIAEAFCNSLLQDTRNLVDAQYLEYTETCNAIAERIKDYLVLRTDVLRPYVLELQQKNETGHNCLQCAGKCHVQHQLQIANAIYTTREIKQMLSNAFEIFPIPENIKQDLNYRKQRLALMRLDKAITELIYMEEVHLLPAILNAQTNINAHR